MKCICFDVVSQGTYKNPYLHNNRQLNIEKKNPRFKWRSFTRNKHLRRNKRVSVGHQQTHSIVKKKSHALETYSIQHWAQLKSTNQIKFLEHNYWFVFCCAHFESISLKIGQHWDNLFDASFIWLIKRQAMLQHSGWFKSRHSHRRHTKHNNIWIWMHICLLISISRAIDAHACQPSSQSFFILGTSRVKVVSSILLLVKLLRSVQLSHHPLHFA